MLRILIVLKRMLWNIRFQVPWATNSLLSIQLSDMKECFRVLYGLTWYTISLQTQTGLTSLTSRLVWQQTVQSSDSTYRVDSPYLSLNLSLINPCNFTVLSFRSIHSFCQHNYSLLGFHFLYLTSTDCLYKYTS